MLETYRLITQQIIQLFKRSSGMLCCILCTLENCKIYTTPTSSSSFSPNFPSGEDDTNIQIWINYSNPIAALTTFANKRPYLINSTGNMEYQTNLWNGLKEFSDNLKISSWVIHYDRSVSIIIIVYARQAFIFILRFEIIDILRPTHFTSVSIYL